MSDVLLEVSDGILSFGSIQYDLTNAITHL